MYKSIVTAAFLSGFFCISRAQNDTAGVPLKEDTATTTASDLSLLDELDALDKPALQAATASNKKNRKEIVYNAFGGTHLINGQTTETINKKTMAFIIAHRFGRLNSGWRDLFGLDQASMRMSFEYGILDNLTVGFGRSTFNKTFDGYIKYRFLDQRRKGAPFSMAVYANTAITSAKYANTNIRHYFSTRMSYAFQLLITRKFNDWFTLQISPSVVHQNFVPTIADKNTLFVFGAGMKVKLSKRMSLLAEYYARIKDVKTNGYRDAFAIGLDVVTGGHVFQFQFTNAQAMFEQGFMRQTTGNFWKGDIHFGFNISRTWGVGKEAKAIRKEKKARKQLSKTNTVSKKG